MGLVDVEADSNDGPGVSRFDEQPSEFSAFPIQIVGPFDACVAPGDRGHDFVDAQGDAGAEVKGGWVGEELIFQQDAHGQVLSRFAMPGFPELASSGGLFPGKEHSAVHTFPLFGPGVGEVVGAVDPL